MESLTPPDWQGARWIGSVDLCSVVQHSRLKLLDSGGYERARLLVREGSSVRGFVDVEAPGGLVDCGLLTAAVEALPEARATSASDSTPAITVIVCTRDRASHLRGSLAAILRLDYPNFEVLVVDNAARTTETRDIVRDEFRDPRVSLIAERVPGLAHARNTGLRHARGDIVAFTDDDTVVDQGWLREIAVGFRRAPNVACVSGLVPAGELRTRTQAYFEDRVSWSKNIEPKVFSLAEPPADLPMFPFTSGAFSTGANFALDRRTALSIGAFDTAFGAGTRTGGAEDIDMFTRLILNGHTLVVEPAAIVWHRHRDDVDALRLQARAYGNALGAWITKLLMDPRTARLALARSPHAVRRLLSLAQGTAEKPAGAATESLDEWDREIARIGRLELISVARGPLNYLLQRRSGERVAR
ncbi:glycosyltransferase [Pseudarthrobacter sp. H2]|uniref:glycosyltransferase n=1 Tax=Pseudarthrobacter sp. H2 TaxID=3418415 RepID=UPI003CE866FA